MDGEKRIVHKPMSSIHALIAANADTYDVDTASSTPQHTCDLDHRMRSALGVSSDVKSHCGNDDDGGVLIIGASCDLPLRRLIGHLIIGLEVE
ncbi:hypothetical protein FHT40_006151 [Mycolicibacterium sp. BK556]|uniref:hypothetical protein n=1 Tax=unclassified Mycolicibacterium TaxID=2636767 RepID=UPI001043B030|nr:MULTISPECIES: hypothetical protein [unclassified Mycolicibacterium]MBB3606460.1 hypothetical protein [Mycolicibacterium sp. BK556]MBB3636294.1 hypothetical protein [Mycolicibacterium sp. BK607]